jgi:Pentatricopeptide repeat domain
MNNLKTEELTAQWRWELRDLKESVKQKLLNTDTALALAKKIKIEYLSLLVKPNSDIQNAHLQLCQTLKQATVILSEYRAEYVNYTTTTFNILISLSDDIDVASAYFVALLDAQLKPNIYTFNTFIAYCNTVEQGYEILKSMHIHAVKPNTQTYNVLLSLITDNKKQTELLKEMEDQSIDINLVTFNTMISCSSSYDEAIKFYKQLKLRNLTPTINTFVTLLKKAKNQRDVYEVEKLLDSENIKTNNSWDSLRKIKKYDR